MQQRRQGQYLKNKSKNAQRKSQGSRLDNSNSGRNAHSGSQAQDSNSKLNKDTNATNNSKDNKRQLTNTKYENKVADTLEDAPPKKKQRTIYNR